MQQTVAVVRSIVSGRALGPEVRKKREIVRSVPFSIPVQTLRLIYLQGPGRTSSATSRQGISQQTRVLQNDLGVSVHKGVSNDIQIAVKCLQARTPIARQRRHVREKDRHFWFRRFCDGVGHDVALVVHEFAVVHCRLLLCVGLVGRR